MNPKIIVIGSSNVDFIMRMERIPKIGETVPADLFMQVFGGKGANQAVGAARAGGDVWFVNCVGDDAFGPLLLENLKAAGIHVDHVRVEKGIASGAALIMVGSAGENCISVAPGANSRMNPSMLPALAPLLHSAGMLLIQYEIPSEMLYASINLAHTMGLPVMFNLAPVRPFDAAYLAKINYLVVNEIEAQSLCGFAVDSPEAVEKAADALLAKGAGTVVITLGAQGAYLAAVDLRRSVPAFRVNAVDTTAAGDIFCGALAVALVEGKSLPAAARFASAASAISVTRLGAQPSAPTREEIEKFLSKEP
jgi:ribokinase